MESTTLATRTQHRRYARITEAQLHDACTPSQLRVLVAISMYADSDGRAFPSIRTIVEQSGLSRRTVFRALHDLETLGLIERGDGDYVVHETGRVVLLPVPRMTPGECHGWHPRVPRMALPTITAQLTPQEGRVNAQDRAPQVHEVRFAQRDSQGPGPHPQSPPPPIEERPLSNPRIENVTVSSSGLKPVAKNSRANQQSLAAQGETMGVRLGRYIAELAGSCSDGRRFDKPPPDMHYTETAWHALIDEAWELRDVLLTKEWPEFNAAKVIHYAQHRERYRKRIGVRRIKRTAPSSASFDLDTEIQKARSGHNAIQRLRNLFVMRGLRREDLLGKLGDDELDKVFGPQRS